MISNLDEIVIIDDMQVIAEIIKEELERVGFTRIETFCDSVKAIEEIKRKEIPPIIITDYDMPQKNGVQVITEVRSYHPGIKAIVITQDPEAVIWKDVQYKAIKKDKKVYENLIMWLNEC